MSVDTILQKTFVFRFSVNILKVYFSTAHSIPTAGFQYVWPSAVLLYPRLLTRPPLLDVWIAGSVTQCTYPICIHLWTKKLFFSSLDCFLGVHVQKWDYWFKGYEQFYNTCYTLPDCSLENLKQFTVCQQYVDFLNTLTMLSFIFVNIC